MAYYNPEPKYEHGDQLKVGILLANLGTPDAPTAQALRPYLRQFLSDRRIVEIPRLVWWFILNCIILAIRPKKIRWEIRKCLDQWRLTLAGTCKKTNTAVTWLFSTKNQVTVYRGIRDELRQPIHGKRHTKTKSTALWPHTGISALPAVRSKQHRQCTRCSLAGTA